MQKAVAEYNKNINNLKHEMEAAMVETAPIFLFVLRALPELETNKAKALAKVLLDQYLDENDLKEAAKSDYEWNDMREVFAERRGLMKAFDNLRQFFTHTDNDPLYDL